MTTPLIHGRVTKLAMQIPDTPAVVAGHTTVTYARLEHRANQIARLLDDHGCRRGDRVAFLLPKGPDAIATMLAILKVGCAYVPLDPAGPAARLERIVELCRPRIVISGSDGTPLLHELAASRDDLCVGWLDQPSLDHPASTAFTGIDIEAAPTTWTAERAQPSDAAYVLFTSGSTGTPKGVVVTHANVTSFLDWAVPHLGIAPGDRTSAHSPLHFDLSVFDVFGSLSGGATLHVVDPVLNLLPHKLVQFMRDTELTQWFSVPSLLTYVASHDAVQEQDLPSLERLLWCGEVLPTATLVYWMERLPHVRFTNLYGPTETTIASSFYDVPAVPTDTAADIPIGSPCDGEQVFILDENLRPVGDGTVGEIAIGGVGLAAGYWEAPDLTAQAFVHLADGTLAYRTGDLGWIDPTGLLRFVGRRDSQVKTRGYRVELGEVHNAVSSLAAVRECAVVAVNDPAGFAGKIICCAYVPVADTIQDADVRRDLTSLLPHYMIPHQWMAHETLPRNPAGKIDLVAIREQFEVEHAEAL